MYTPDTHHVVHIGGASFVPPVMAHFAHAVHAAHSTHSSLSPSSEASSPTQSRFSTSSGDSLDEGDAVQAQLAYARRMADHTASMWQRERLAIEKAKLDGTYTGNLTSRHNGNARPTQPTPTPTPQPASNADKRRRWSGLLASLFSPQESPQRGRSRRRQQS